MINRRTLRVKVLQLLFSYYQQKSFNVDIKKLQFQTSKELDQSILNIEKSFFEVIVISIILKNINLEKKEIAKNELIKKSSSRFIFSSNSIVNFLEKRPEIIDGMIKHKIDLDVNNEKIRSWYYLLLKEDFYADYMGLSKIDFEDELSFYSHLLMKFILKKEDIIQFFEERNIYWNEDLIIIKSMMKKTLKTINSSNFDTFALANLSEDIKDDIKFASSLFDCVIENTETYDNYLSKFAQNWELDRISVMDKTILRMGIGEMIFFKNIPIKVTINECIDIAKIYSSPKSGKFINGLLDVISLDLLKENKIIKSGKGLIDNK